MVERAGGVFLQRLYEFRFMVGEFREPVIGNDVEYPFAKRQYRHHKNDRQKSRSKSVEEGSVRMSEEGVYVEYETTYRYGNRYKETRDEHFKTGTDPADEVNREKARRVVYDEAGKDFAR